MSLKKGNVSSTTFAHVCMSAREQLLLMHFCHSLLSCLWYIFFSLLSSRRRLVYLIFLFYLIYSICYVNLICLKWQNILCSFSHIFGRKQTNKFWEDFFLPSFRNINSQNCKKTWQRSVLSCFLLEHSRSRTF